MELKFKSNINCHNCLAKVQPVLDAEDEITNWSVDLQSDDRILTVETEMTPDEIRKTVLKAGFLVEEKWNEGRILNHLAQLRNHLYESFLKLLPNLSSCLVFDFSSVDFIYWSKLAHSAGGKYFIGIVKINER